MQQPKWFYIFRDNITKRRLFHLLKGEILQECEIAKMKTTINADNQEFYGNQLKT